MATPLPNEALVLIVSMFITTAPATPTPPVLAEPATATLVAVGSVIGPGRSMTVGLIVVREVIDKPVAASALPPMNASVCVVISRKATAAPTTGLLAALKPAPAASVCGLSVLFALTVRLPVDNSCDPGLADAIVVKFTCSMATLPAIPTPPVPPAAAAPQAMNEFACPAGVIASSVIAPPRTTEPDSIVAEFVTVAKLSPADAPILVESERATDVPMALVESFTSWLARTTIALVPALTLAKPSILAMLVTVNTLMPSDAAMPSPPPLLLEFELAELFPLVMAELPLGNVLVLPVLGV